MSVPKIEKTKKVLQHAFDNYDNFTFIRIGDGDLVLMTGQSYEQRHNNSPILRKELKEAIKIIDDRYIVSSTAGSYNDSSGSYFWLPKRIQKTLDDNLKILVKKYRPSGTQYHALVFQYCLEHNPEWFVEFFKNNLKNKKTLFIAGKPLCDKELVNNLFNVSETISFPGLDNAYYKLDNKMDLIYKKAEQCDVVIPCIGMATRVLAKRFWKDKIKKIILDVGVSIDALAEEGHRGWTKRMIKNGFVDKIKEFI